MVNRGRETEETKYGAREGEREGWRRNGVLPLLRHTHALQSNSSRARTEHPSILLFRKNKAEPCELLKARETPCIIKPNQSQGIAEVHCSSALGEKGELGVKTDGPPFSTSDSDHGSNGGGRSSAR